MERPHPAPRSAVPAHRTVIAHNHNRFRVDPVGKQRSIQAVISGRRHDQPTKAQKMPHLSGLLRPGYSSCSCNTSCQNGPCPDQALTAPSDQAVSATDPSAPEGYLILHRNQAHGTVGHGVPVRLVPQHVGKRGAAVCCADASGGLSVRTMDGQELSQSPLQRPA